MMGPRTILAAALLAVLAAAAAGCGRRVAADGTTEATPMNPAPIADVAAELMAADSLFAAQVAAADAADRAAVWAGWFAPAGRQLVPADVVTGRADIAALMSRAFADPAAALEWAPDLAAGDGRWGWTSGRYVSTRPGPDGPVRSEGRYLTVWERQADGAWAVAVDTGVPDPE